MRTRREMLKLGLMAGATALVSSPDGSEAKRLPPSSPTIRPFIAPLPIMPVATPVAALNPAPNPSHPVVGEDPTRAAFQRFSEFPPQLFYEIHEREQFHVFHPDLPNPFPPNLGVPIWGYDGIAPGPTFHATTGVPILVRFHNDLPPVHTGFGSPETAIHLHSGHTASESDGFPTDFFAPGLFRDYHYPNLLAGGDPLEAEGTCWYHDHRKDFTSHNTCKGLVGCFLLYDNLDNNDETNPNGYRLPSGQFDIPLVFSDQKFNPDGTIFFDPFNNLGHLGDKFLVNGMVQPFLEVARRKYRFRMVPAGPSRFWQFFLSTGEPFIRISSDAHLLPQGFAAQSVFLGVAERADVIIDFSQHQIGDQIFLQNRLIQTDPRGPSGQLAPQGDPVLRFDVISDAPDPSRTVAELLQPGSLRGTPAVNLNDVVARRTFIFDRQQGAWAVNGLFFDETRTDAAPKEGTAEIWTLRNNGGGWSHPVHIHMEEFRILSRKRGGNVVPVPPEEQSMKDVFRLGPNEEMDIFMRFRDFNGKYPCHCHNTVHEDHDMMFRWDVLP